MGMNGAATLEGLIRGHLSSMRLYAEELETSTMPVASRNKVVKRIKKCADEVDAAFKRILDINEVADANRRLAFDNLGSALKIASRVV